MRNGDGLEDMVNSRYRQLERGSGWNWDYIYDLSHNYKVRLWELPILRI
jgi:hypothetical protein